jgi:Lon-like protease
MAGYAPVATSHEPPSVEGGAVAGASGNRSDASGEEGAEAAPSAQADEAGGGGRDASGPRAPFRWKKRHTLLAILAVIVIAAVISAFIQLPYYAITPGSAPNVATLIAIPKADRHSHRGSVLLVYVEITPMRAIEYPFFWLDPNASILPSGAVLGVETPAQYNTEGEIDMATAQQAATVVALKELGYKVPVTAVGALIYGILPGSPASSSLQVGDVIDAVNGKPVSRYLDLQNRLEGLRPYSPVTLGVFAYPAGKKHTVTLRMGVFRIEGKGSSASLVCLPQGQGTNLQIATFVTVREGKPHAVACLGIYPQGSGGPTVDGTAFRIGKLPINVNLSSEGIVGPSAGLAFTLGLMQELDPADLTGGLKVAATGTMSIDGTVGDVGAVAQKTIAVGGAGATVFFVPKQEYSVAKSKAGPHLRIYAVSSISQVISILKSLGGRIEPPVSH